MTQLPRITLLCTLSLATLNTALAQSPAIQTAMDEQISEACMDGSGQFETRGITVQDITGDGLDDLILDHGFLNCQGMKMTCGMQACSVVFYIQEGGRMIKRGETLSMGVSVGAGNPPILNLTAHGGSPFALQWNGREFATPSATTTTSTATTTSSGRWQYDPSKGLAGQASIQGEQNSTLLVDCGNGGFPALFLLNANTPQSDSVVLTFTLDGLPAQTYSVSCDSAAYCTIESDYEATLAFTRGLMARNTLTVSWNRHLIDRYSLAGSSAAISQMGARGCEL